MRVEAVLRNPPLADVARLARQAEALGFDGLAIPEIKRDPFVLATLAAQATSRIRISTAVALAFPRSPTVAAYAARSVSDLAQGRFVLGLGTQVKAHVERRFGVSWSAPSDRLRDYIGAVRAVLECWHTGAPLDFDSEHYRLSLMTPEFSPGSSDYGPIPIQIGAVNARNLELAAEVCDGVRLHPFCTPEYTRQVVRPHLAAGVDRAGRSAGQVEIVGGGFIITGPSSAQVKRGRDEARRQIGFYASTPTYAPVLALHGWADFGGQLRRLIARQQWDELASAIDDEVLDAFCIAAPYEELAGAIAAKLGGLVNWIALPLPERVVGRDRFRSMIEQLRGIPEASH